MLDLNTLIPPGSGLQLTNAFNINDRGEILAKAAPLGFTPNDDADLGHLVLLVPCGPNGPGCEVNAEGASRGAQQSSARITSSLATPATQQRPFALREGVATWRARMARRYQFPVVGPEN